jgi:hypothetical protein
MTAPVASGWSVRRVGLAPLESQIAGVRWPGKRVKSTQGNSSAIGSGCLPSAKSLSIERPAAMAGLCARLVAGPPITLHNIGDHDVHGINLLRLNSGDVDCYANNIPVPPHP